jgi:predicted nucleic acid-binding protein
MIHLDTSFLIVALVRGSRQDRKLREWLRVGEPLAMSTVAWAEFLCGPVDGRNVELAARLFNQSGRRRGSLADCMIAATALRNEALLATNNPTDFGRFEATGLTVIST